MEWQTIVALVVMVPVIMLPVALVWYINLGGILAAVREARARRVAKHGMTEEAGVTK